MDTSKLKVGNVYKNYRHLCNILGIEPKTSNSKLAHLKEWNRYFSYKKDGNKFIITELYNSPKEKKENRGGIRNLLTTPLSITNPLLASEWDREKNGYELPDNMTRRTNKEYWWVCRKCNHSLYSTPLKRLNATSGVSDNHIKCAYCNLSIGAKKIYSIFEQYYPNFTMEYMFDDLKGTGGKSLRFDFAILNQDGSLLFLIEYDGQYHNEKLNPELDNYILISTHDKLKDEYCKQNNIPLLRISYLEIDIISYKLIDFCKDMQPLDHLVNQLKVNCNNEYLNDKLTQYEADKAVLLAKLKEVETNISIIKNEIENYSNLK